MRTPFAIVALACCVTIVNAVDSNRLLLKVLQHYMDAMVKTETNETICTRQISSVLKGMNNSETWPLLFLDASAKLQPSLGSGNTYMTGGFDECMNIQVHKDDLQIKGQYCKTAVMVSSSVNRCIRRKFKQLHITGLGKTTLDEIAVYQNIYYDVCVPAGCPATSLQKMWNELEQRLKLKFSVIFDEALCSTVEKQNTYSLEDKVGLAVFIAIALIVVLSTLYDVCIFQKRENKDAFNVFMAFSFYTNGKRLFSVKAEKSTISCLNGIRSISIVWIIVGHRTLLNFTGGAMNTSYLVQWFKHHENMFIMGAFASVDTFFLISGFLIVYLQMMIKEQGHKINIFVFYIHRILRLTPAMAAMVLLHLGLANHLGSGPFWYLVDTSIAQSCTKNWWKVLLYIQNYAEPLSGCITQTWYLAADTQLYFISPLIVLPLLKWTNRTIALIVGLFVASSAHTVYLVYSYELDGVFFSAFTNYWQHLYLPTHLRITPWLAGVLLGYYMFLWKDKKILIRKRYVVLFWIIAMLMLVIVMYGYILFFNIKFNLLEAALFAVLSRVLWSIGIGWVIFACERGYGGLINDFLSLPVFTILARLSYSMFLTHFSIIILMSARTRTNTYIDNLTQFHLFWGDYAFCVGLSIIWTLTFESPITILEKSLQNRASKTEFQLQEANGTASINNRINEEKQYCAKL